MTRHSAATQPSTQPPAPVRLGTIRPAVTATVAAGTDEVGIAVVVR